jgi:hypothetical protein
MIRILKSCETWSKLNPNSSCPGWFDQSLATTITNQTKIMSSKSASHIATSSGRANLIVDPFSEPSLSSKRAIQKSRPNLIPVLRRTRITANQAYYNLFVRLVLP